MAPAILPILGLFYADVFNNYVVWLTMPYLTDVWKLDFTTAAMIVNLWRGFMSMLPICMLFLADILTGKFWMLSLCSVACSAGMGLLSLSTPAVLSNCTSYEPECISKEKRILFFLALTLTAFGISGLNSCLFPFFEKHIHDHSEETEGEDQEMSNGKCIDKCNCLGLIAVILITSAAIISLSYIKPWSIKFMVPAIITTAATLAFLCCSCLYNCETPQGSPFTTVLRVLFAAVSKWSVRTPRNPDRLYKSRGTANAADNNTLFLHHTNGLSCLDKAAVILPNRPLRQQRNHRWRLCTVTEVEETKIVIRLIPMCSCFIVCGLVSAIGHTYFMAQANHLNRTYHNRQYPLLLLPFLCDWYKHLFNKFRNCCSGANMPRYIPAIGIGISMIFAILCCICAAKFEKKRLDVVKSHDLVDKPDAQIPMYFWNLRYQFALLGALDAIFEMSVDGFFANQVPPSIAPYMTLLSKAIRGTGIISSVLSVFVVGKISEKGGTKPSWFQATLNKSRLDNYYWTLTVMASVNLVFYTLLAFCFDYRDFSGTESSNPESREINDTLQELAYQNPENSS